MNGYVEAGYVVVLGTLGTYGVTLVARERAARRRLGAGSIESSTASEANAYAKGDTLSPPGDATGRGHGTVEEEGPGRVP